ncbi:hypothetical protein ACFQ1I_05540 [Kitasatospora arboriphila]
MRTKPISSATATIRCRVASETPGCPFSALETDTLDTPTIRAMSLMVGRRAGGLCCWDT